MLDASAVLVASSTHFQKRGARLHWTLEARRLESYLAQPLPADKGTDTQARIEASCTCHRALYAQIFCPGLPRPGGADLTRLGSLTSHLLPAFTQRDVSTGAADCRCKICHAAARKANISRRIVYRKTSLLSRGL